LTDVLSSAAVVLDLLRAIEARSRSEAAGLPVAGNFSQTWVGVVVTVAGEQLVVALDEISEILNHVPTITRVPGAKIWLRGVANVRGNLLPVCDLQGFLGGRLIVVGRRSRVLVIRRDDLVCGVLVNGVLGMRHFRQDEDCAAPKVSEPVGGYILKGCSFEGATWPVFSMGQLAIDPQFQILAK
jgi:twitching motility protein PilI